MSVPFGFGAVHHVLALLSPAANDGSSATRHALFVGINLLFAALFALRARWVIFPALLLAAQQLMSHGSAFLAARRAGQVDVQSLLVLAFLPVILLVAAALARRD